MEGWTFTYRGLASCHLVDVVKLRHTHFKLATYCEQQECSWQPLVSHCLSLVVFSSCMLGDPFHHPLLITQLWYA